MADLDRRTPFERYCRQPGTRINAIMTRLERGEDERSIADRYKTQPATIRVYRKALEGRLSKGSVRTSKQTEALLAAAKRVAEGQGARAKWREMERQALILKESGMRLNVIAKKLGLTYAQTKNLIYRGEQKGRLT